MTTSTTSLAWSVATAAGVNAWVTSINTLFTTVGLVATSDTGQVANTGAVGALSGNGTRGYQVFKFPDTLQATQPIFIRADFNANSSAFPYVKLTVGSSTNGAGTIGTPQVTTLLSAITSTYLTPLNSYACYNDGTFACVLGAFVNTDDGSINNNAITAMVIDRARSSTGTALVDGYLVEYPDNITSTVHYRSIYGSSSPAVNNFAIPSLIPSITATGSAAGTNVNVFRHYMMTPGVTPSLGCLSYFNSEFGALTPFTATVLGSSHTYLPMGLSMNQWSATAANAPSGTGRTHCCAIRWE
jgi:hypothetical protein